MKASRVLRALARWHRWLGLAATAFIVWLAVSGFLIHRAASFGLEEPVQSAWILDHYRIGDPDVVAFELNGRWISQAGKSLYLDRERIAGTSEPLVGAVRSGGLLIVASREQLTLFDERGRLVETVRAEHGLPPAIRAVAVRGERIVLDTYGGLFEAGAAELQWRPVRATIKPAIANDPPAALRKAIVHDARSRELRRERVLRDLHSGGFFGAVGEWIVDIAAFALLTLSVTGVWLWVRKQREFGGSKTTPPAIRNRGASKTGSHVRHVK